MTTGILHLRAYAKITPRRPLFFGRKRAVYRHESPVPEVSIGIRVFVGVYALARLAFAQKVGGIRVAATLLRPNHPPNLTFFFSSGARWLCGAPPFADRHKKREAPPLPSPATSTSFALRASKKKKKKKRKKRNTTPSYLYAHHLSLMFSVSFFFLFLFFFFFFLQNVGGRETTRKEAPSRSPSRTSHGIPDALHAGGVVDADGVGGKHPSEAPRPVVIHNHDLEVDGPLPLR
jgi:hypothetical protein